MKHTNLKSIYDICIIGAGVVGAAIARHLAKFQIKVLLTEAENDVSMGASKANSAIVHGGYAESHAKTKGQLCYQGRRQFAQLEEELHFGFRPTGSLVFTTEEEKLPEIQKLYENGIKNGLPDLKILNREEILAIEPQINPDVAYALYCKGAGICSPYEFVIALVENAVDNGVDLLLNAPVTSLNFQNEEKYWLIQAGDQEIKARFAINAAGINSAKIANLIGDDSFTIRPRSGEYLLLRRGLSHLVKHVLFPLPSKMGKGILVAPTYHCNIIMGPDAHDEDFPNYDTHLDRILHVYNEGRHTISCLDIRDFIRSFTGVRTVSSTDDFVLGPSKNNPQLIHAAGIQSPGLTSSPAIAEKMEAYLHELGLKMEVKKDFNPHRPSIIPCDPLEKEWLEGEEAKAHVDLPEGDPDRFVCRCEQVREKTFDEAIKRSLPIHSRDALKRRVRAGMGPCQGSFCRSRVLRLFKEKYGIELSELTDIQVKNIQRVTKTDILEYLKKQEEN